MANANGWGDGASNNNIGWGKGADNAIGWGAIHANSWAGATDVVGTPAVDPDAQAFITAASITDPTQQSAINQLVVDLKGYNIWTKMKAVYPFVGGTAAQHKWNLKDPRDLDAAFRLVFNGGWTHSSTGALPNGTNGYADTKLNLSSNLTQNNTHLSFYSRTNTTTPTNQLEMGAQNTGFSTYLGYSYSGGYSGINSSETIRASVSTPTTGMLIGSRIAQLQEKYYFNNVSQTLSKNSNGVPNSVAFIGASRHNGSPALYSSKQCAFASIGDGLTDTEAANFYTAVQAFQVTLGRSIGTQTVSDADAQAFVTAADIQDQVEANAVNNLVIGLKADGLWTKMRALYPFVGGTSTTNSYNLKNTAQYQITWYGGLTHSSTGVTGNGTNGYGDSFLANNVMGQNDAHLSIYSRTNLASTVCDIGSWNGTFGSKIYSRSAGGNFEATINTSGQVQQANSDSTGFYLVTRKSSTSVTGQKNSTQYVTALNSANNLTTSIKILRPGEYSGEYSPRNLAFASIGDGLTDTEAANFYNRVQTFNTALARQV